MCVCDMIHRTYYRKKKKTEEVEVDKIVELGDDVDILIE